ncbi:MAG: ABC transporter substrate-binding protein [Pelistega sp.]|nr:ABC transporter substrate-binding protein [Pelistega sp.]
MMLLKKFKLSALAVVLGMSAAGTALAQDKFVAITAIVEHPALDAVRDGVIKQLEKDGFAEGKNLKVKYQSAQGNTGTAAQIARQFIGEKPDAIVAIGTPSAQAVVAATKTIPVVFAAITDPVAAQLVKAKEPSGTNVTGVSDVLELEPQINLIKQVVPNVKKVGVVYNPGEANSAVVVKQLKEMLAAQNIDLVEASAPRSVDVSSAARSLIGKVDAIYTTTDNNVVSAYEALVKVGNEADIPLIASDTSSVERGAIAALGLNYFNIGEQSGAIVSRVFKGENPGTIAFETSKNLSLHINKKAAAEQGVTLNDELVKTAEKVFE